MTWCELSSEVQSPNKERPPKTGAFLNLKKKLNLLFWSISIRDVFFSSSKQSLER